MRIPGASDPFSLFFDAAFEGLHKELERAQQDPSISPEMRKDELWRSYVKESKRFQGKPTTWLEQLATLFGCYQGKPTAAWLEQLATLFGCYLYWQERNNTPQFTSDLAELGAAIRRHLLEQAIIEEFGDLTEGL